MNRRSPPIPVRENPAVKAGLFRVYVTVNNYRTNYDDYLDVYLFGIQSDNRLTKEAGLSVFLNIQSLAVFDNMPWNSYVCSDIAAESSDETVDCHLWAGLREV